MATARGGTLVAATLAAVAALTGCGQGQVLRVDEAMVRVAPVADVPSVAYFTVHGGPEPVELLQVFADDASRAEMHETAEAGGTSTMRPLSRVPIPAKGEVRFEPGGKHVMLHGMKPSVLGRTTRLTFLFSNEDRIIVDAATASAGDAG